MRIIAGEFRSRRLKSLPGAATRPTPDSTRLQYALPILRVCIALEEALRTLADWDEEAGRPLPVSVSP